MTRLNIAGCSCSSIWRWRLGPWAVGLESLLLIPSGDCPEALADCTSSSSVRNCILQWGLWLRSFSIFDSETEKGSTDHSTKTPFFSFEIALHFGHTTLVSLLFLKIMLMSIFRPGRQNESQERFLENGTRVDVSSMAYSRF